MARIRKDRFMCTRHWAQVPRELRKRQVGLVLDLDLAPDADAVLFIISNLAVNQRLCIEAVQRAG